MTADPANPTAAASLPPPGPAPARPDPDPAPPNSPAPAEGLRESVARIESLVREVRTTFETHVREERHEDFSYLRMVGVILQVAAAGLLLLAGLDWLYQREQVGLFIKAIFALVIQAMAATALLMSRRS